MKQTQNQYYGKRKDMPNKLPPGSTYICSDEDSFYHAREDGKPILFNSSLNASNNENFINLADELFVIERDENSKISRVSSKHNVNFPSPVIDNENQITTQYYDIESEDNGSIIDIKYEGNWFVNLPSINGVDDNFQVYVVYKQNQNVQGSITAYSGDLIDGNVNRNIYGQGFINLKKIRIGIDNYQWFVFNQVSYNTVEMQGKTRRFDFVNQSTIQLQHDLGFIPVTQAWVEDGEGGFVEVNVDIDHDWQTMNSLEISFGTPQTGKIIY
tara:strand:+ start:7 stop:816 length:810 start_codon:yes stop_codon:yes gene_type:complete